MKKWAIVVFALFLAMMLLTGCGAKKGQDPTADPIQRVPEDALPTAEDLVRGGSWDNMENADMDFSMVLKMQVSTDSLRDGLASAGAGQVMMNMGLSLDAKMLASADVVHMDGTIGMDILGMSYEEPLVIYATEENGRPVTYSQDSATGIWKKSYDGSSATLGMDFSGFGNIADMDLEFLHDLRLMPVGEDDQIYTVQARVKSADLYKSGLDLGETAGEDSELLETMEFVVTMGYDRETKHLKSMMLDLDPETVNTDDVKFETFGLSIYINSVNETPVSIPQEVFDNALEEKTDWNWDTEGSESAAA